MQRLDRVVRRETAYIAVWTVLLSVLMQAVFLIIGAWDYTVLLGNLLTALFSILNFLLMGITVQKALEREEKDAKSLVKLSQALRMLALFAVLVIGVALPFFDTWACIIPVFFVRISLFFRPMFGHLVDEQPEDGTAVEPTNMQKEGEIDRGTDAQE